MEGYVRESDGTCREDCPDGTYWNATTCANCILGCKKCVNGSTCEECGEGYVKQSDGTCKSNFNCSGADFMKITVNGVAYCVTKKNMGDSAGLSIPADAEVTLASEGAGCSGFTGNRRCCWKTPSQDCSAGSGTGMCSYSGCGRTVCTWAAGDAICKSFKAGGKTWTLPSDGTINANDNILAQFYNYAKSKGDNGMCLCDQTSTSYTPYCYTVSTGCSGSCNGNCYPHSLWGNSGGYGAPNYILDNNSWSSTVYNNVCATSVRCVTKL